MSPAGIQQGLSQSLGQQQTLSPHMRQSLEILQANTLELSQLISQIAEINPTLEISEEKELLEEFTEPDAEHDYENLSEFDDTWREDSILQHGTNHYSADDEERRQFLYDSIVSPKTLQQHLIDQLNHAAVPDNEYAAAEFLIGCLDGRGFLTNSLTEITIASPFQLDELLTAQELVQGFDPQGIGVENLRESLLLQLKLQEKENSLEAKIVAHHLDDLARRRIPDIAKALGVSPETISRAAEQIAQLNPDPGANFDATANPHVTPDLEIRLDSDGQYFAKLTGDHLPKIKISNHYKDLLAKLNSDPKALKFLRDNIQEGRQIINAVSQRQETLLKIGREIITRQPDFLKHGVGKMRPMTMHDLAESIGVHSATISRAVSGKYILTPHGLMELRSFFTSGYKTEMGNEISNSGVRDAIQQLVSKENPTKPLSDSAMHKQLKAQGLDIARRTIAKYRDQLGILPSHLRKKHV